MFDSLSHDGVKRPGAREMTVMLAGLMALNAFAIDAMVPALPAIGRSLHVASENHRQLVVVVHRERERPERQDDLGDAERFELLHRGGAVVDRPDERAVRERGERHSVERPAGRPALESFVACL